jgi:hypothetical protein
MTKADVLKEFPEIPSDARLDVFLFFVGRSAV